MTTREALFKAVKDNPNDVLQRNILADYLDENGEDEYAQRFRDHTSAALYPEAGADGYFGAYDYTPLIDSLGRVLVRVDDSGYQGDTRLLLENSGKYGFLVIGWGSCSGCDALQSCRSYIDLDALVDSIRNDVKWFDSLDAAKDYILDTVARETEHYYHRAEWETFANQVREYKEGGGAA